MRHNQPIVMTDVHSEWDPQNFTDFLLETFELANTIPCDLQSNVLVSRSTTLNGLLKLTNNPIVDSPGWFLTFRICDFLALKGSRLLWNKPVFFPLHFRPFVTSWIMMSDQYRSSAPKPVLVNGLVTVAQLSGAIDIILQPKNEKCSEHCQKFEVELNAGDLLVFSSDIWTLSYWTDNNGISITFIAEFEWNY